MSWLRENWREFIWTVMVVCVLGESVIITVLASLRNAEAQDHAEGIAALNHDRRLLEEDAVHKTSEINRLEEELRAKNEQLQTISFEYTDMRDGRKALQVENQVHIATIERTEQQLLALQGELVKRKHAENP